MHEELCVYLASDCGVESGKQKPIRTWLSSEMWVGYGCKKLSCFSDDAVAAKRLPRNIAVFWFSSCATRYSQGLINISVAEYFLQLTLLSCLVSVRELAFAVVGVFKLSPESCPFIFVSEGKTYSEMLLQDDENDIPRCKEKAADFVV